MQQDHMAICAQTGETIHGLGAHPRKELLARLGRKRASKIYRDLRNGSAVHTGYIVAGLWWELFEVSPFRKPV